MVDCIEYCVNQTGDHVDLARGELFKAEEYQSKARKVKNIRQHRTHEFVPKLETEICSFAIARDRMDSRGKRHSRSGADFYEFRSDSADMNAANSQSRPQREICRLRDQIVVLFARILRCIEIFFRIHSPGRMNFFLRELTRRILHL